MASTLDSYKLSDGDHVLSGEIDLVFCATQDHAVRVRNFINQVRDNPTRIIAKVLRPKTTSSASSTCASFRSKKTRPIILVGRWITFCNHTDSQAALGTQPLAAVYVKNIVRSAVAEGRLNQSSYWPRIGH